MKRLIFALLTLFIGTIIMFTFTACRIKKTASAGKTTENLGFIGGNIAAGGLMAGDRNGWVFYRSEADGWKLYKAKLDGAEKTLLSEDCPYYINVLDGWVYYANYRDNFSLYRIRTDGTERHKLIDGYCWNLHVADSGIYFDMRDKNNSAQVYHMELDGSAPKPLVADMQVAAYFDGVLYCRSTNKLCAYNIQTGVLSNICEKFTHNVYADETGVYYWAVDENTFCHTGFSGQEQVLLTGGDFFNYTEGKLYYFGYGGNNHDYYCIYCLDVNTGTTAAVLSLSDQCFDASGNLLGITIAQVRDNAAELDESYFDNDEGVFNGFSERAGYTYVIEGKAFSRGGLRESILSTGKLDCWILYDNNGGIVWD